MKSSFFGFVTLCDLHILSPVYHRDIVIPSHIITRVTRTLCDLHILSPMYHRDIVRTSHNHPCITCTLCDLHILSPVLPSDSSWSHGCLFRLLLPFERRVRGEEGKPLPVPYVKPRRAAQAGTTDTSAKTEACSEEAESTGRTKPDKMVSVRSILSFQSDV